MILKRFSLYLDDVRTPISEDWAVVRNYDEFVAHIKMNGLESYEVISLDHDLGNESKSGYDAAKWLVAESMISKIPLPQIYVHSANPVGADNIIRYINNYSMNCQLPQTCIEVKINHN